MVSIDVNQVRVEVVGAERVRPMRQRVLRPHQTPEQMVYPGDDDRHTFHLAGLGTAGQVLGIASYYREPHPLDERDGDWRLRGMAVADDCQGMGLGRRLIEVGLSHLREQGSVRLWCNARVTAQPFYERLGFVAEGEEFEIPTIGPHYVMCIAVSSDSR